MKNLKKVRMLKVVVKINGEEKRTTSYNIYNNTTNKLFYLSTVFNCAPMDNSPYTMSSNTEKNLKDELIRDIKVSMARTWKVTEEEVKVTAK